MKSRLFKYKFFLLSGLQEQIGCDMFFRGIGHESEWNGTNLTIRLSGVAVIADSFKFTDLLIGCKVNYS